MCILPTKTSVALSGMFNPRNLYILKYVSHSLVGISLGISTY